MTARTPPRRRRPLRSARARRTMFASQHASTRPPKRDWLMRQLDRDVGARGGLMAAWSWHAATTPGAGRQRLEGDSGRDCGAELDATARGAPTVRGDGMLVGC
jgi:hypothetical protein